MKSTSVTVLFIPQNSNHVLNVERGKKYIAGLKTLDTIVNKRQVCR